MYPFWYERGTSMANLEQKQKLLSIPVAVLMQKGYTNG